MSKKRYIDTNFWSDTWVDQLDTLEKFFFLYLLTNDRTSIAGIYEIPVKRMRIETDLSATDISRMFKRMETKARYIDGWVVLRNGIKSQNYKNEKIRIGIKAILETCPVELLQFVDIPKDLGVTIERVEKEPLQQRLIDDPSMTLDETSHLIKYNSNSNLNSNSNTETPDEPSLSVSGNKKELTQKQKNRNYAIAMDKEREQAKRAEDAKHRTGTGLSKFQIARKKIEEKSKS